MKARRSELEQKKGEIEARFAEAPADMPDVHPNIAEHYRAKVIRLAETLAEPEADGEAREDIRSLVGEVVITPGEKRGKSHAVLRGELTAILDLAAGRRRPTSPTHNGAERRVGRAPAMGETGSSRARTSPVKAKAGFTSLSCRREKKRGYPHELGHMGLPARHAREHGPAEEHPCLANT